MKWIILTVASLALFASVKADELDEGSARLGYITVGNSGATTLTFNATSIQNAVILGLFIIVLGALVLPLFGITAGDSFDDSQSQGYGYGYEQAEYGYQEPYSQYSKR